MLHLDAADAYGSQDIALSLEGFHEWAQAKTDADVPAEIPPALSAAKRKFNLALRPTLVPALSPFVDTLIASGAANYSGFRLLEAMALLRPSPDESSQAQPELKSIPASKEEIFNSKELSLVEKRRVMKFLQFAIGDLEQAESLKGQPVAYSTTDLACVDNCYCRVQSDWKFAARQILFEGRPLRFSPLWRLFL